MASYQYDAASIAGELFSAHRERGGESHGGGGGSNYLEQALAQSQVKAWQASPFTADLCESILPASDSYGDFCSAFKAILSAIFPLDLSEGQRAAVQKTIRALERSENIFRRREQHLAWGLPFHMSRVVDETCRQLHSSNVGDIHIFPFQFAGPTVCVVNHISNSAFSLAIICVNPTESTFLPFSADKPPKLQVQSVLEVHNIPKKKITSEAFWAIELVAGGYDDTVIATHVVPWLNGKPIADLVRDTRDPAFATGSKNDTGNVWKSFIHAFKYIARTACNASKAEIKAVRVMIKRFFLERAFEDLKSVENVDHSTRLIVKSALQNSSLCLARNAECLSEDLFHTTRRLIDNISDRIKTLPSTDEASTQAPPALNMDEGWDKLQYPEQFPFMECLRRLENVDHFAGTAVEQPRYVPVNFFNVPEKVTNFDQALYALDMALHVVNRIVNQQAIVRRAPFMIVAFLTRVFLEVIPAPLGPKSRNNNNKSRKCVWHPEKIRYGQQIHAMNRLWNLAELFSWASFAFRSDKEFDSQRITVLGMIATMSDAVIRQLACDQPSIISKHLRGFRRKAGYAPQVGRFAAQTENSVSYNPNVNLARCSILDYHNEVCEDIPPQNVMFPWEDGWSMCKATTAMLRQMASIEGLPVSAVQQFFQCEDSGGPKVIPGRYYHEFKIYRDLYIIFKIMMGARGKLPSCQNCLTCMVPSPAVTVEMRGGQCSLRVKWMHSDRFAKAVHLRFPSYAVASKFTAPFEAQTEDDILHIKNLPDFDNAMGQRDSELLLSYLTTPYLRIPLVLNFFATEDRVSCLSNSTVRNVLESVLFEPSTFLPHTLEKQVPQQVPSENPALIATSQGILFNEVQFSPKGLVEPLIRLVTLGREMDAGTVQNTQVVDLILFLVRLASRVDNFLTKYVNLAKEYKESNGQKTVRGLHFRDDAVAEAVAARSDLHKVTVDVFVPMMESWLNELIDRLQDRGVAGSNARAQSRQIDYHTMQCSRLYAHIIIVLRNIDPETELTANTASLILSSIIFITTRYNPGIMFSSILVHEAEIFDAVELQRRNVARFLQACSPKDLAFVMDSVTRVATSTGKRVDGHSFAWGLVAGADCVARYTRVDNIRANSSDSKKPLLLESVKEAFGEDDVKHSVIRPDITCLNEGDHDVEVNIQTFSLTFKAAHLVALPTPIAQSADLLTVFSHSAKLKSQIPSMQCAVVQDAENRMWVRLVGQEMDVQRWTTADPRIPLPEQDMRFFPDDLSPSEEWIFKLVEPVREMYFIRGFMAPPIFLLLPKEKVAPHQSVVTIAAVCSRTGQKLKEVVAFRDYSVVHVYDIISIGRRWYRKLLYTSNAHFCLRSLQPVVADRFQLWKKPFRHAAGDFDADTRSEPTDSVVILRHPTHPHNISKALETFLPSRVLWGLLPDVLLEKYEFWQDPDDNIRGYPRKVDDGKDSDSAVNTDHILWMHWRELNFDPMCSFHGSKQVAYKVVRFAKKNHAPKVSERAVLVSQKWEQPDEEDDELARMRTNTNDQEHEQEDKPVGLSDDDNEDSDEEDEHQRKQFERMGMFRQASAVANLDGEHDPSRHGAIKKIKPKKEIASIEDLDMLLINLMYAREGTPLHSLAKLLARIETLSHILCFTTQVDYDFETSTSSSSENKNKNHPLTIDLIQLPRLKLTFAAKIDADGVCRVYSLDHAHLFVSNLRPTLVTQQLIQGMPHSIILGDSCDNLSILVPALHVVRPQIQSSPFSTELVVNRSNKGWYQKLDTRYYLYPVHVSLSFLFTPTLASALYLIALRFLHCEYEDVFRLASTIGTDMSLSDEEEQNFRLLAARDNRHEAIACRVKIGLLVADSPVDLLWYLPNETARMIRSYSSIGLSCRLNVTEERRLLQVCRQMMNKVKIVEEVVKGVDMDMLLRFVPNLQKKRNPSAFGNAGENAVPSFLAGNIYAGLGTSEVKAVKEMFAAITTRLREELDLRINRDEVTRTFLMYWSQRRTPLPDFYRCLLLNRDSYLRAEAESVAKAEANGTEPEPVTCKMLIPERDQDELWAFYRDYDVLSCKLPSAQEMNKNDADRIINFSNKIDYFYCGQNVRKNGCRCKHCEDDTCGPEEGCPCLACEKWNKKRLAQMRYLPKKIAFNQQRIMSFFDVSNWIEDVMANFQSRKSWLRNMGSNIHPTVLATTSTRCSSLRSGSSNFMRMYELLTGSTKCRIGSADSAKDIVHLLFPLCHEARRPEAALGHLMHYLLNNPQVLPKLPKSKNFGKDDTPEIKLSKVYAAIFQHAASDCRYPPHVPAHLMKKGSSSGSTKSPAVTVDQTNYQQDNNDNDEESGSGVSLNDERTIIATVHPRPSKRTDPRVPILATRLLPTLSDTDRSRRVWNKTDLTQLEISSENNEKKKTVNNDNNKNDDSSSATSSKTRIHIEGVDIDNVNEREQLESVTEEMRLHLRTQPLLSVIPPGLVRTATRTDLGEELISDKMPFDLRKHEAARTSVAQKMISRLEQDLQDFAQKENSSRVPRLDGLCPSSKAAALLRAGGKPLTELREKLEKLVTSLTKLREDDIKFTGAAFRVIERTVNAMPVHKGSSRAEAIMHLRRLADQEAKMNLTYIISSLCSESAESHWMQLNPFLTPETIEAVMNLSTTALLRANRVGHANRAAEMARELVNLLKKAEHENERPSIEQLPSTMNNLVLLVEQKADSLASMLSTKRVYIEGDCSFDPRFLLFEYTWNIVLRARQRQIIDEIHNSVVGASRQANSSVVKQMIMGAGKTTVVGPLLAMMLADSKNLVMQVVPPALLDFTRSVLRATFSTVLQKQIFCFIADRASDVDSEVIGKFVHAKNSRGIVVTTPSSIKSVFLKMIEGMDRIEDIARKPYPGQDKEVRDVRRLVDVWRKDAILVLDEVDMILHTLKSELNFPVGQKHEIDFAPLRWKLPIHLFDAVFYATGGHLSTGVKETPENLRLLDEITEALQEGLETNCLQGTPHTTLLNLDFYENRLRRLFARWALLFLKANHFTTSNLAADPDSHLSDEELIRYVTLRPSKKIDPILNKKVENLEEEFCKLLNLMYDWVVSFLPHCLQKIDRVSFGIMNNDDMTRAKEEHPSMPKSRFVTAIPFIGKDLPSPSSEFAHPDVVIGLTILAYRYEGLRNMDYTDVMRQIFAAVEKEVGRYSQRRTNIMYTKWVQAAGGKLISSFSYTDAEKAKEAKKKKEQEKRDKERKENRRAANIHIKKDHTNDNNNNDDDDDEDEVGMQPSESMAMTRTMTGGQGSNSTHSNMGSRAGSGEGMGQAQTSIVSTSSVAAKRIPNQIDILPLRLMKQANREESNKLFKLFKRCPEVIHWYLCNTIFPNFMRHQLTKLSASGQELGGNILFQRRIGFSGTPSDLLPQELGSCEYEKGTDGKLLYTLTNQQIMSVTRVERDWTVRSLLDFIANADPPYHALIDTGALITGMSNLQVAQYLLKHGLPSMEGVVFLDELDRKMILVRATGRVLKLAECGIPKVKRFALYDQVHTTGMDIEHTPNAVAVQTLGKDMTFRDFSQGAYRMRGIGQGQKVDVLIIPEVYDLIQRTVKDIKTKSSSGPSSHESAVANSNNKNREMLIDVSTWLLVNSIRSEHIQHNQLCLQTIANVWRKEAFRQLRDAEDRGEFLLPASNTVAEAGGTERKTKVSPETLLALNVFREPVNYAVPTDVPQPRMFSEAVQTMVDTNISFIVGDQASSVVKGICDLTKREDEVDNPVIDVQMVQEQEEEREQEEEKQKEHEIEMEKFVDLAYSRDDEAATPWALTSLRDLTLASQFYPLSDFRLHKRRPLRFPDSVMISRNFFNPKWSGQRRIKNAIISLEWLPDADNIIRRDSPDLDYCCLDAERQESAINSTLSVLRALEGPFSSELVRDFAKIALGQNNNDIIANNQDLWNRLGQELSQLEISSSSGNSSNEVVSPEVIKSAVNVFLKLLRSNQLRDEEKGRYSVLVTLAEAETIRRVIHLKKISGEDFLSTSTSSSTNNDNNKIEDSVSIAASTFKNRNTQVCLRMVPAANRVLDYTPGFKETPNNFQRDRNYQSIRFFDGDLHYLDADLNLLLRAIHSSPQRMRQTFFLQTLSCRRRARQRWENSPVALAFNLGDAFSWLHQKTLGLCLRRALERRDLHLADAFVAINSSQTGKLTPDEVWGAFRHCGMANTTAGDVLDFVQVADTHHEGSIHFSDFLSMLTGSSEIEEDGVPGGGGKEDKSRLPSIEPYGSQQLSELILERARTRRSEEKDANQQLASEEQAIREEIERETIKEELTLIQTSQNPLYDENKKSLLYSLHEGKPPRLAQFFGHVDPALVEDTPDDTVKSGGGIEASNHPEIFDEETTSTNTKTTNKSTDDNSKNQSSASKENDQATTTTTTKHQDPNAAADSQQKPSTEKEETNKKEDTAVVETKHSEPFFGLSADGGMRLVARSIKLLNESNNTNNTSGDNNNQQQSSSSSSSSVLRNYGLHMEFRVPQAKLVGRKKVKLRKFSEVLPGSSMTAVQFNTRTWSLNPSVSRSKSSASTEDDDEATYLASMMQAAFEASDSDQDKKGDENSDDDEDSYLSKYASKRGGSAFGSNMRSTLGRHSFVKRMKMLNYVFKETDPKKENRLRRLKLNSSFQEHKSGKRINTTLGGDSYEWMKISKPIAGWVVFQVNGIQMLVRERISVNLTADGLATIEGSFPKDGGIADLPPTSFAQKKKDDESSDDDTGGGGGWWSGWDTYFSFFNNQSFMQGGAGGNDEADDDSDDGIDKADAGAAVDLGDIGDLMSEIRRKKELKAGDKVRRNPAEWSHGDQDGGDGIVGRVIKTDQQGSVTVQWPNGNKTTCLWGQSGKFELIKVASKGGGADGDGDGDDDDQYFGRDVENNPKWAVLIRTTTGASTAGRGATVTRCSCCSQVVSLANSDNGWLKCNVCPGYHLCLKCFRAQEHEQHSFTDLQVLSSILKETMIMTDSHVRIRPEIREPQFGWGNAPRDGTPGTVRAVDEENASAVVNFGDGVTWTGLLDELELLDPRHEVLSTSWLGNLFMMTPPLERRRHFKKLSYVVDQSLALPVVASAFAVGDRVKAMLNPAQPNRYYPGEIRATLAGSKYVVAFDDGHVNQDVPEDKIEKIPFKMNQKVRILRKDRYYRALRGYNYAKLPLGVQAGHTGEIAAIVNNANKQLRITIKVRTGVSISRMNFLENEIEPVQPTQWFFRRVNDDSNDDENNNTVPTRL